jgi:AcrR family transcriptional regulator
MEPDADRTARRVELLDAADRVIKARGPEASMTAIAAEAGITKPILYRHFGDKSGLYRALAERYIQPVVDAVRTTLAEPGVRRERAAATVDAYLAFIEANPQIYRFLMHRAYVEDAAAHSVVSEFVRRIGAAIAQTLRDEFALTPQQEQAAEAWGHALVGMMQVASDWWLATRPMPREAFVEHMVGLLWDGLGNLELAGRAHASAST